MCMDFVCVCSEVGYVCAKRQKKQVCVCECVCEGQERAREKEGELKIVWIFSLVF